MHNKKTKKSCLSAGRQKGVSLIIVFFVMLILIAIILSASTLLFSEIKIVKNIGSSVASFYVADSGIEKVLYYDRKVIPDNAIRGICDICSPNNSSEWSSCTASGTDCADCKSCHIDFTTLLGSESKFYNIVADVSVTSGAECGMSVVNAKSYGNNENIKRAINLDMTENVGSVLGPGIDASATTFNVKPNGTVSVYISAIVDAGVSSVTAYIYYSAQEDGPYTYQSSVELVGGGTNNEWHKNLGTLPAGFYKVSIGAVGANGVCASVNVTQ